MAGQKKVGVFGPVSEELEESLVSQVHANNCFGLKLHQHLSEEGNNLFFSPFSISTVFAMLFRGASGQTIEKLREALGYNTADVETESVNKNFGELLEVLNKNGEHSLCVANAVLTQAKFPFLDDYKKDVEEVYQAKLRQLDFGADSTALDQINQWVKDKTGNMIEKLFDSIDPHTVMILLSAVYFKGSWSTMFEPKNTKLSPFYNHGLENEKKDVPMMFVKGKFRYFQSETYQAVELPYKGETMSMIVVLPEKRDGLRELETGICTRAIEVPKYLFRRFEVSLAMPKLDVQYSKTLNSVLKDLGLSVLFSPEAEFARLTGCDNVYVSQVEHKAILKVNEEGTEAAAVTGVVTSRRSLPISVTFTADHPFLFFIIDSKRNLIMFMGRIDQL